MISKPLYKYYADEINDTSFYLNMYFRNSWMSTERKIAIRELKKISESGSLQGISKYLYRLK